VDQERLLALLEATHNYPGVHRLQIIVRQDEALIASVLAALARQAGLEHLDDRHERIPSRKGSYVSLRVRVPVQDAAEVLALYEVLGRMEGLLSYF